MRIDITDFALRNWQPDASGTRVLGIAPEALVAACNAAVSDGAPLF